ncbi:MAG TPA: GNAT family N-acetyltransferase [Pirellulales bacterium]|nr:GNAT family N-acetyltransferase [Pirellulales bacterium]
MTKNGHRLVTIRSTDELRSVSAAWDDLWLASEVRSPLARAEAIVQWVERFAPDATVTCLAVEAAGRFVAGLPLVGRRLGGLVEIGGLAANCWALCGDLLISAAEESDDALDRLLNGVADLDWPLIRLQPIVCTAPRWRAFAAAARRHGLEIAASSTDVVGQVEIAGEWQDYQQRLAGNHRRHMRKAAKRAKAGGRLSLEVHTQFDRGTIADLLRRGCELEDRSWKGSAGTSILRVPGMFEWFLEQAQQLAACGQLQLTFLELDRRPIAFEYGYRAKATYFSHKVGYDPAFADLSPGQLLRSLLLERFFQDDRVRVVDFWGPLSDATGKWATSCYPVGSLIVAPDRLLSRLALRGYRTLRPYWRRSRHNRPITRPEHDLPSLNIGPPDEHVLSAEGAVGLDSSPAMSQT